MKTKTENRQSTWKTALLALATLVVATGCATRPIPFGNDELQGMAAANLNGVAAEQEPIAGPITMYEAMVRALKYNLDYKVEMMTETLRTKEHKLSRYDLLPTLIANGGYYGRSNFSGASSSQILSARRTGDQSLVSSTSSERETLQGDAQVSWDILDFGLSYVRSKQQADEILIAQERKRKVAHRIIEDVRSAYWRAVSAERLVQRLSDLENDVSRALRSSRQTHEDLRVKPLEALTYQRELLETREEAQQLQRDLMIAKQQLAALMNLKPDEDFSLVMPARSNQKLRLAVDGEQMINIALTNRPELREVGYRQRINKQEGTAALLNLLPSIRASGGFNYDDNNFLFSNDWFNWSARASWNLLEAFKYPARKATIRAQDALLEQRSLALTMAVMTQVHVSRIRYEHAQRQVETMRSLYGVQSNILSQIHSGYAAKRVSFQSLVREKMNAIVADARYDIALAALQSAYANVYSSMGLDPYGQNVTGIEGVSEMAKKLEDHWVNFGNPS